MIASRHWMIAVIAAAFLHVLLASLLLAKADDRAPVMLSAGGLEVGLSDADAGLDGEIDAKSGESLPAEVPVAEVKQAVVKTSAALEQQPVPQPQPVQEPVETPVAQPVEPVKIEAYEQPAAENAIAVQSTATEKPQPEVAKQETSGAENSADVAQAVAATSGKRTSAGQGSGWGQGKGKGGGNGRLLRSYFGDIAALIDAHKDYPGEVKKEKQEGTVIVAFSINRKGELLSSVIQKSSGYALLDKAALATLARSSPFPPIPKAIDRDILKIAVPIDYTLITN